MTDLEALVDHLARSTRLERDEVRRLVREVIAFFGESPAAFVARRHAELHRAGLANAEIYAAIVREVAARPFAGPELSVRQVRRMIYG